MGRVAVESRPGRLDVEAANRARGGAPHAPAPCQAFFDTPLYPAAVRGRPSGPGAGPPAEEDPARPRQPHPACFLVKRIRRSPRRLRPIGVRATRGSPGPAAGAAPPGGAPAGLMLGPQVEGRGDVGQLAQGAPVAPPGACRCVGRPRRRLVRPGSAAPRPEAGQGTVDAMAPFSAEGDLEEAYRVSVPEAPPHGTRNRLSSMVRKLYCEGGVLAL